MVTKIKESHSDVRRFGTAGVGAGLLWIAVAALTIAARISENQSGAFDGTEEAIWGVMTVAIITAGLLTLTEMVGIRHELGLEKAGVVGIGLVGLGTAAGSVAWAFPLWGGLMGIGMLIFSLPMIRQGNAPRSAAVAFGFGMLGGIALFILLDAIKLGPVDSYGDYPVAIEIGFVTMALVSAYGTILIGRWLTTR